MGKQIVKVHGKEIQFKKELKLNNLGITDISEIEGLDKITNLRLLSISNNPLSDIKDLANFSNLTSISWLSLHNNQITEIAGLEKFSNLGVLNLSNNQITEIKGLDTLKHLATLLLNGNQITEIKGLENNTIYRLGLYDNKITELKGLGNQHNLSQLLINGNHVSEFIQQKWGFVNYESIDSHVNSINEIVKFSQQRDIEESNTEKLKRQEQVAEKKKEYLEKEAIEKLKKMLKVSESIKMDQMQRVLKLDQETFDDKIFDWAAEFNFKIKSDEIIINQETVDDFIDALDKQFDEWDNKEQGKIGKLD